MNLTSDLAYLDQNGWNVERFRFADIEIGYTFKKVFDGVSVQLACSQPNEAEWVKLMQIIKFIEDNNATQNTNPA